MEYWRKSLIDKYIMILFIHVLDRSVHIVLEIESSQILYESLQFMSPRDEEAFVRMDHTRKFFHCIVNPLYDSAAGEAYH